MSDRGATFDAIAEEYDRYRETYPADFIRTVLDLLPSHNPGRLCEIGCGSGQATVRLADLSYNITCIEPGSNLLEIARKRLEKYSNVSFINAPFESAAPSTEKFDIVFAAQSLHWVPTESRFTKTAEILKPSGSLLAVWRWNYPLSGSLGSKINDIFAAYVPAITIETMSEYEQGALTYFDELVASKRYWQCQVRRISYGWEKDAETYVNWIRTWSQLAALPELDRANVCRMIQQEINSAGGKIFEGGETVIIAGRKRD